MKQNATLAPIRINSSNIDLGEALPRKVQEEILHVAETHFGHLKHATVGFTRDGHWYCCTINVQVGNLKMIIAEATATNCNQAFDLALAKIGNQLLRRKKRAADSRRVQPPAAAHA
ncbi:HPF/RaiA family ribosome-associated protein [Microvirga guangxiensis]|uniref:Ribosomal subunit interface protein n=1 Tax=Microvirga guangxiensis TaxID=549386 RepID=A0A1G5H276_9HYPH|nr:HPF/RaiA family ribosome-associated protein [Microvirga guangxiensis]SCY57771.1 ribosomal subunit interface protein [Microvirga guangxiensis]